MERFISPSPKKIFYAGVFSFMATVFFTIGHFFILSVFFSMATFLCLFLINRFWALLYFLVYFMTFGEILRHHTHSLGSPLIDAPYDCQNHPLVISSNQLAQDSNSGFFTYSFWMFLNGPGHESNWNNYRTGEWKSVFFRGDTSTVQYPGIWLTPVLNNMVIVFKNGTSTERLEITNIAMNEWAFYSLVVEGKSVFVYINGKLERILTLVQPVSLMNGYNLYVAKDGGFAGSLSRLVFHNYAMTPKDIMYAYHYGRKKINMRPPSSKYTLPGLITNSDVKKCAPP